MDNDLFFWLIFVSDARHILIVDFKETDRFSSRNFRKVFLFYFYFGCKPHHKNDLEGTGLISTLTFET